MSRTSNSIPVALIDGAIAGALATWVLGQVTNYLYAHENKAAREREDQARNGQTAYAVAAEKAAELAGTTLSDDQRKAYGERIHWALGMSAGAVYGALRSRAEHDGLAHGLAFGTAFFLLMDETVTPALGLTPGPTAFPWQTHARGLAGHLAFGVVANTALDLLEPAG